MTPRNRSGGQLHSRAMLGRNFDWHIAIGRDLFEHERRVSLPLRRKVIDLLYCLFENVDNGQGLSHCARKVVGMDVPWMAAPSPSPLGARETGLYVRPLPHIHEMPFERGGGGHDGADQMRAALVALAAFEVAI